MLIFDRLSWQKHRPWVIGTAMVAGVAIGAYLGEGVRRGRVPDGTSFTGFAYGVVAGLIIIFEFLLWPRKRKRAWRVGAVQVGLRAHIWLGLLTIPLLLLHSGFRWGGSLSTWLAILYIVVILSGLYGLVVQQWLTRKMLLEVPAETIHSQIQAISDQFVDEASRLVADVCGTPMSGMFTNGDEAAARPDRRSSRRGHAQPRHPTA